MNTLSWLIYAGEITGGLKTLFVVSAFVGFATCFTGSFAIGLFTDGKGPWARPLRWLWLPFFVAVVAIAIPSAKTIYMIAASEAGETVVTSPDAIEMMGDLKAIIKKRLKDELSAE